MNNMPRGIEFYRSKLKEAVGYGEIWETVKETVKDCLAKHRVGMMLFLDDLPLKLGAYHPVGSNNIVLNKRLVEIVQETIKSKNDVNAFVYSLLAHEYLHALGYLSEDKVRHLVHRISRQCFGENHIAAKLAEKSPWALLQGIRIDGLSSSKGLMEIVKDFEKPSQDYVI
jgi:hypothetical protein